MTPANAHDESAHCASVKASVTQAGFDRNVSVTCSDNQSVVAPDTYPDHDMMTGFVGTNEQLPVPTDYFCTHSVQTVTWTYTVNT